MSKFTVVFQALSFPWASVGFQQVWGLECEQALGSEQVLTIGSGYFGLGNSLS